MAIAKNREYCLAYKYEKPILMLFFMNIFEYLNSQLIRFENYMELPQIFLKNR